MFRMIWMIQMARWPDVRRRLHPSTEDPGIRGSPKRKSWINDSGSPDLLISGSAGGNSRGSDEASYSTKHLVDQRSADPAFRQLGRSLGRRLVLIHPGNLDISGYLSIYSCIPRTGVAQSRGMPPATNDAECRMCKQDEMNP